ncbi:MAG: hypothetical protein JKY54_13905 [Flavobacteriales bacterium]|nr:hypothetical protein [Flavobacteriales bacterium]
MKLATQINNNELEPGRNGTRANSIKYDNKKTSKDLDLYVFVDFDGYEPLKPELDS